PAAAIPDLEKAVELLPDSGALVYHLALAYEAVDRGDDAEAQFRRARELKYVPSYERLLTPAKSRPRRVRPSRAES
ncbi:MAG TPA: tetratricopeptide repeat protein, partial [Thermoanaerobaculia bacterium]|nr:tetratricopeptide repeat protein [Thermoanaerobaculia bacterium]